MKVIAEGVETEAQRKAGSRLRRGSDSRFLLCETDAGSRDGRIHAGAKLVGTAILAVPTVKGNRPYQFAKSEDFLCGVKGFWQLCRYDLIIVIGLEKVLLRV